MKTLIINSNWRLWLAIATLRITGRGLGTMAEVYDAMNQRKAMRDSARFSLWFMRHEEELRNTFNLRLARKELEHFTGDITRDFNSFIHARYASELLN